jgi:hypothetical protein
LAIAIRELAIAIRRWGAGTIACPFNACLIKDGP